MPRQRGGAAPRRPTAAPAKPAVGPPKAPARQSSTAAHPQQNAPTQQAPAPQASQGPGLFGQMASTAAGVAVGSSIGHAIGGFFGGGSSAPAEQQDQNTDFAQQHQQANYAPQGGAGACQVQVGDFRKCMDENQGSLNICGWYLDQLKACQSAASQY
ncbi:hypothetical protein K491DRAFT_708569 [Lophiostoma macrostomum CBS 122681]|uniref:CHCH domain-containing protein n=1 Tax=Lophiostoma macrostomum CBS 122681 TaxID=1314788 RepID=A0A6A6SL92_9PLEO|nr:hypothetical protein K491DRAFT_708569 [Lophiostoma macrostomum CBS 122681]